MLFYTRLTYAKSRIFTKHHSNTFFVFFLFSFYLYFEETLRVKFLVKQSNVSTYGSICHLLYCLIRAIPWNTEKLFRKLWNELILQ